MVARWSRLSTLLLVELWWRIISCFLASPSTASSWCMDDWLYEDSLACFWHIKYKSKLVMECKNLTKFIPAKTGFHFCWNLRFVAANVSCVRQTSTNNSWTRGTDVKKLSVTMFLPDRRHGDIKWFITRAPWPISRWSPDDCRSR